MGEAQTDKDALDVTQAFKNSHVQEVLDGLDRELVGLQSVKTRIREIAAFLLVDRLRREVGLGAERPALHMCFTGRPGTGKTTVAMRMAQILHRLGYIRRDHLITATRDDLVGQYVGHTAPKTKEVLKKAMGGVLFIDEAYYLYRPENERDYGQEAIEILLQVNLAGEAPKGGAAPEGLGELLDAVAGLGHVRARGLMAIPPEAPDPEATRVWFRALRKLGERHALPELSMGMSGDFEVAVEEGATMVRVGTAIFGPRPPRPGKEREER